jgi:dipeptidyl aminopeptidase/acylaminoacyl peptidase
MSEADFGFIRNRLSKSMDREKAVWGEVLRWRKKDKANPDFWNSIDPTFYLNDIVTPIQIEVGLADNQVPPDFSKQLYEKLKSLGKTVTYYEYPNSNHDINQDFEKAMQRTIDFFNLYLR